MFNSKRFKVLITPLVVLVASAAVGVAPAAAEVVSAKFSGTSMKMTTTGVTVKKNALEPKTCTLFGGATQTSSLGESLAWVANVNFGETLFSCSGSTQLENSMYFNAKYDTATGKYSLRYGKGSYGGRSPYGNYGGTGETFTGTWVNGSEGTPSTLTFAEAQLGLLSGSGLPITLSGTFNVTTKAGTVLTLSH